LGVVSTIVETTFRSLLKTQPAQEWDQDPEGNYAFNEPNSIREFLAVPK